MQRIAADNPELRPQRQSGYTLLELLFVLAILLLLAGMAWPRVQGLYERHQLQSATEDVRVRLTGTRFRAIDSGLIYQFRYEPGGQNYIVVPYDVVTGTSADEGTQQQPPTYVGRLPASMRFEAPDGVAVTTEQMGSGGLAYIDTAGELRDTAWSAPILFIPDGTATDDAFDVIDEEDRFMRLSVRGLTAAVTVSQIVRRSTR